MQRLKTSYKTKKISGTYVSEIFFVILKNIFQEELMYKNKHIFNCACVLISVIMSFATNATAQNVTIKGTVTDDTKSPLEFAQVHIEGQLIGVTCDLKGRYSLSCESRDSLVVVYSMIGYQTRKRVLKNPTDTVRLNVMLPPLGIEIDEVQINEIRRQTGSMSDVNLKDMKHMGNASGGGIEKIIATQAGVSTHNELSSQYNVRGGSFDENSVYINGIEVYRPLLIRSGQQEGLSIINPDMVESVGFSAGGFEAKYGDKMSSVLDIQYKKAKGFESSVSASLLGASVYAGYGNSKFSMTHALRYKTTSYLLGTMETKGEYDPRDFDYQTYINWTPNQRWEFSLMGNIASNDYNFTPSNRTTKFGTAEDVKEFKVYFDGQEKDRFRTYFGSMSATYHFNRMNEISVALSAFRTNEEENFDINGEYWLNQEGGKEDESLGIGTYHEHARNRLTADVRSAGINGRMRLPQHDLKYGLLFKWESVDETMREWEMRDSAGYSLPHSGNSLDLIYNLASKNKINTNRFEMYAQDTYRHEYKEGEMILNYGFRISHWSWNNEWLFSPRATIAFVPAANDNFTFRFSTGLYYQSPFYKELKDTTTVGKNTVVVLNKNIKSQRSIHFVLGGEYRFKMGNRPFKATAEAYYKALSNLIPYNVDNVRISYYGRNMCDGYAVGLDMKLYGEFVPGTDSWISMGIMKTEEKLNGKWIPRPTDQRYNFSVFFSDYFPNTDKWKMSITGHYADGLPFGPPHSGREKQVFRMAPYRRVDLGMSYRLLNNEKRDHYTGIAKYFKNIWLGIDAFNILGISNVNSYYWVTDVSNHQYAVPNYLTGRKINARILLEF